ncbi:MAG: ABC transporter permease subunit [Verrucomicrobia bacterium]|nr:ABC transporter permease subunit [Verrucomicrobiota bacterium]
MIFWLQLRDELWKLFGKKRTYIGFVMFLLAQNLVSVLFRFTHASRPVARVLEGNGYLAQPFLSTLTIASIMLVPLAGLLLPLYVALVGGDLVAKEAEDGTLRMILSRPVTRLRLLLLKWLAGAVFSALLVGALGAFGLLFARVWFPWSNLFFWNPELGIFGVFDPGAGLRHYLAAHALLVTEAVSVMGLGFMLSCFNVKPAAATILALSFLFVNLVLQHIPYFQDYQNWFLTYHLNLWQFMFAPVVPWWKVGESFSVLFGFNLTFLVVGCTVFQVRDIKT